MGDYSRCPHNGFVGYCDICSPGWKEELERIDKEDETMTAERTPTPRVDAQEMILKELSDHGEDCPDFVVSADFARQLERELNEAYASLSETTRIANEDMDRRVKAERALSAANERAASVEAHAARYQWLRQQEAISIEGTGSDWSGGYFPEKLDTWIDEQRTVGGKR